MATKTKKGQTDASRFEGNGISYKAKLIGVEDVPEARGDQMCQETITRLKTSVKMSGQHKQKVFVNVTLEGLKIIDAISLPADSQSQFLTDVTSRNFRPHASNPSKKKGESKNTKAGEENEQGEKTQELNVLHTHAVHRISFISRDTTDNRAFGYIYGEGDGSHKFFAIKTAAAAEQLVLTLRDLFQVVYDMKKKEMDEAKLKLESGETQEGEDGLENGKSSGDGSTSRTGQTPQKTATADAENIYQVPTNNAPVNPESQAEQVANLLDLEDQADHILKGIEQIKNLEFDAITSDPPASPTVLTDPMVKLAPPSAASPTASDPWSPAAAQTSAAGSSALGDLAGLQTSPFHALGQQPGFGVNTPFSLPPSGYGVAGQMGVVPGAVPTVAGGLPVTKDPFANDPFSTPGAQPGLRFPAAPAQGFGVANPFGGQAFGQPFPGAPAYGVAPPAAGVSPVMMSPTGMMPGVVPPGVVVNQNPFAAAQPAGKAFAEDPNLLTPIRKEKPSEDNAASAENPRSKSPREDLFGDLIGIKKSTTNAVTPKDMFAQINASEKKSLNAMKTDGDLAGKAVPSTGVPPHQASDPDPFGSSESVLADKTRGLLVSGNSEDPFNTSHISAMPQPSQLHSQPSAAPPVPRRHSPHETPPSSLVFPTLSSATPPPLPSRSEVKTKELTDNASSSDSKSFHLPLSPPVATTTFDSSPTAGSFMLPSPEGSPPPLPTNLPPSISTSQPPPPPPPPRPSIKSSNSSSSSSLSSPRLHHSSSNDTVRNSKASVSQDLNLESVSSSDSTATSSSATVCADSSIAPNHNTQSDAKGSARSSQFKAKDGEDPFTVSLKLCTNNNNKKKVNDPFAPLEEDMPPETLAKRKENEDPFSHGEVISMEESFSNLSKRTFAPKTPQKEVEKDAFGLPLHPTPGFKAVAKFGDDPFEESFNGGTLENDPWDAFGSDSQNGMEDWTASSPFGDSFTAPPAAQPVNGNGSKNSLLD